ncbi:hypothetical protein [Ktedonobacter robiniae]|uniref:Opine dehydrogenase domain-containing protein n=1 Tax=Ktedonobacter robiniae TaxID=2778365 RepID=A0ABQ3UYX1_9CHLR|nr:hypothetical protein [Ktedonobacter robiniae]GHO57490.1 hypothetical protein KSB_59650 [Ktedonobacter robiniae]
MKILFAGLGNLSSQVFDLFVLRAKPGDQFLVAGRNQAYIQERCRWTHSAALHLGKSIHVDTTSMDVWNIDQMSHIISAFQPDVIFSSMAMLSATSVSRQIPDALSQQLQKAQGAWMPITLAPLYKLMQAVQQTRRKIIVLNAAAPDNLHPVLAKVGLAPTSGIGNLANTISPLRQAIATQLHQSVEHIQIFFFAHADVSQMLRSGTTGGVPFHLTAFSRGEDITSQLDIPALFRTLPLTLKHEYTQLLTAATAATILETLTTENSAITHAPGPDGLPGTYPIQRKAQGIEVILPPGLTREEAIRINQDGLRMNGIESIADDGTVHFSEKHAAVLQNMLGYDCKRLPLSEVENRAHELLTKYNAFISRH